MKDAGTGLFIFFLITLLLVIYYLFTSKRRYKPIIKTQLPTIDLDRKKAFHRVILIGDMGAPFITAEDPIIQLLQKDLSENINTTLINLGDNVYPKGFPLESSPDFLIAKKSLSTQLDLAKINNGRSIFLTGNHDWNIGRKGGWEAALRQQEFIAKYLDNQNILLPKNGCPGPIEVPIDHNFTIIVINTVWWIHASDKPNGKKDGCDKETEEDFFLELENLVAQNKNKHLLIAGHHPLYSFAAHGGFFHLKQHLFPLTELNKKAYLPLPIFGSIYPLFRRIIGSREDIAHPVYKRLRKRLLKIFRKHENLIYASGHDHNLQYIKKGKLHFIVSGSGSKTHFVKGGKGTIFAHAHRGYIKLYFQESNAIMEAIEPDDKNGNHTIAYSAKLY